MSLPPQAQHEPSEAERALLDEFPTLVIYFDQSRQIAWVNLAFAGFAQRQRDDLVGRSPRDLFPASAADKIVDCVERAFAGTANATDITVPTESDTICLRARHVLEHDPQGRLPGVYCLIDEVTGDTRAAPGAVTQQHRIAALGQLTPVGIFRTDADRRLRQIIDSLSGFLGLLSVDGLLIDANRPALEAASVTPEQVLGRPFWETPWWSHDTALQARLRSTIERAVAGETVQLHHQVQVAEGKLADMEGLFSPLRDADGTVIGVVAFGQDVSERKRAERNLRASEGRLRQIIDSLFGFVGLLDLDGTLTETNQTPLVAAGLSANDVLGKPFWETYWWSYDPGVQQRLRMALQRAAGGDTVRYEEAVRVSNGASITIDVAFGPLRDSDGIITSIVAFGVDVTERNRVESELRSSENRLSSFFTAAPVGLLKFDSQMHYTKVNPFMADLNGAAAEDHIGRLPTAMFGESTRFLEDILREVIATKSPSLNLDFDGEVPGRPGERTCLDASFFPFVGPLGELEGVGGVAIDVTAARLAQEALAEANTRLTEAQRIGQLGHWNWNIIDGELLWSDEVYRIFGLTSGEFKPTYELFIELVHPEDRQAVQRAVDETLGSDSHRYSIDHRLVRPDGSERVVHEQGEAFFQEGVPVRLVGTVHDITERHRAEQEAHRLNAELEHRVHERTAQLQAANAELAAFGYSVSHDLRAPLRAISGFAQAIEEEQGSRLDDAGRDHLARVRNAASRMGRLIDDLLALAHLTQAEVKDEPVNLTQLASEILEELRQGSDRKAQLTIGGPHIVSGDPALLRVMMQNLLDNAWKYTRREPEAVIEFGHCVIDDRPAFFVRDNGAGFDMRYAARLFGAFQRLHHADEFEGNGIGLATVKRIARRHGGSVWADSSPGAGATFYFRLTRG